MTEFLMSPLIVGILLVVIGQIWAIHQQKRCLKNNEIGNKALHISNSLIGCMIGFLAIVALLTLLIREFILFAIIPLIGVMIFSLLINIIISSLTYSRHLEKITKQSLSTAQQKTTTIKKLGKNNIILLSVLVAFFVVPYLYITASEALIWNQIRSDVDTFANDLTLKKQAKETGNLTICEEITTPSTKVNCYETVDPEYKIYENDCTLYTKHGNYNLAQIHQQSCIEEKFIRDPFYQNKPIACQDIEEKFSENLYYSETKVRCTEISRLQTIVMSDDEAACDIYLEKYENKYMYAACIGNFVGSSKWNEICSTNGDSSAYAALAQCEGSEKHSSFGGTLKPFRALEPQDEDGDIRFGI